MRVFIKGILLGCFITLAWSTGDVLYSSRMYLGEARIHTIQQGEQLSRLAQQYYGDPDYWRELALINRAPRADDIFPGERILLPSVNAMDKLASARRLSRVNDIVSFEEQLAVDESPSSAIEFTAKSSMAQTISKNASDRQRQESGTATTVDEMTENATRTPLQADETPEAPAPLIESTEEVVTAASPQKYESVVDQTPGWPGLTMFGAGLFGIGWAIVGYRRKQRNKSDDSLRVSADNILENFEKKFASEIPKQDHSFSLPAPGGEGTKAKDEKEMVL